MTGTLFLRPADPSDLEPVFAIVQRAARHMDSQGIHQWDDLYPALSLIHISEPTRPY